MKYQHCTTVMDDGKTLCGRLDNCTKVTVKAGSKTIERFVCKPCRKRMKLPSKDVVMKVGH